MAWERLRSSGVPGDLVEGRGAGIFHLVPPAPRRLRWDGIGMFAQRALSDRGSIACVSVWVEILHCWGEI